MKSNAEVVVRRAMAADLDQILEIDHSTLYVSHWSRSAYEKYEGETREQIFHRCLLVAAESGKVVGFVAGSFLEGDETAMLENLAVDAEWRRRGVAKVLCAGFVDWAQTEGARSVDLEVRAQNEAAAALYVSLGFMKQARRKNYYSAPEEDAISMRLSLP